MRRALATLVFAALALLVPARARAATIAILDSHSGFHVDVYTWDGRTCLVKPAPLDAGTCAPSDRASVPTERSTKDGEVLAAAVVHFDGWDLRVVADKVDAITSSFEGLSDADVRAQAARALQASLPPGVRLVSGGVDARTTVRRVNNVPYVRLTPALEGAPVGSSPAAVDFVVAAASGMYVLSFVGDTPHAADVARIADNAIASLSAAPPERTNASFGTAATLVILQLLAAGVVVGCFVYFLRGKKA